MNAAVKVMALSGLVVAHLQNEQASKSSGSHAPDGTR
jgi:hypothetical protein